MNIFYFIDRDMNIFTHCQWLGGIAEWWEEKKERSSAQAASGLALICRKQPRNQRDFCEVLLLLVGLLLKYLKKFRLYILYSSLVHRKICP